MVRRVQNDRFQEHIGHCSQPVAILLQKFGIRITVESITEPILPEIAISYRSAARFVSFGRL